MNKKLQNNWKINLKIETRELLREGFGDRESSNAYQHLQSDYSILISKKNGFNYTVSAGYLVRIRPEETLHRMMQQISWVYDFSRFRIAQRLSTDQTFSSLRATNYRLRYRFTLLLPLNGDSVDPKEYYLKMNNEYLNILVDGSYDLEIRLVPLLGYKITDGNKLEFGIDYRVNSFLNNSTSNRFWLNFNWFISL